MRRALSAALASLALAVCAPLAAQVPAYPAKPVRIVVPYAVGGYADSFARLLAAGLSKSLRQTVIVENKPGANGNIACEYAAKSAPDGHTLLMGGVNTHAVNVSLFRMLPFDPVRDFAPVAFVVSTDSLIVVDPALAVSSIGELVALARAKPGLLTHASGGTGTFTHLAVESLKSKAGVEIVHIPYKGEGEALTALLRGDVSLAALSIPTALPQLKAGKLRALATTGTARARTFPDLPTMAETLPGASATSWIALFAPAGVPREIVARLNEEVGKVMTSPELRARLEATDSAFAPMTPDQLAAFQKSEIASWAEVIRKNNVRVE